MPEERLPAVTALPCRERCWAPGSQLQLCPLTVLLCPQDPSLEDTGIAGITAPGYLLVLDDNTEQEPPLLPYSSQSRLLLKNLFDLHFFNHIQGTGGEQTAFETSSFYTLLLFSPTSFLTFPTFPWWKIHYWVH